MSLMIIILRFLASDFCREVSSFFSLPESRNRALFGQPRLLPEPLALASCLIQFICSKVQVFVDVE